MAKQVDSTSTASAVRTASREQPQLRSLARRFLELIRFSHTVFALPFAVLASILALVVPRSHAPLAFGQACWRFLGVVLCMVCARSAAMAFNRLVDVRFDAENPRTASRHIPAGELSAGQVATFFGGASLAFIAACCLFLPNWLPLAFSLPVLVWICGYSYAKRFTSVVHLWLGIALALSPICAWIAIRGEELIVAPSDGLPAVGLAVAIALWVAGFDVIYSCQDADFDRRSGLRSLPARLGVAGALRLAAVFHFGMLLTLASLPTLFPELSFGLLYYFALACVGALVVRQHIIVSPDDLRRVNVAFFNINAAISFGLSLVAGLDACLR